MLSKLPKYAVLAVAVAAIFILIGKVTGGSKKTPTMQVNIPQFSEPAIRGRELFNKNCKVCHGENGTGTDQGPPFLHRFYVQNHHGDQAFVLAAKLGVRSHHWRFGNMPAQPQVNEQQVLLIVKYIRELQRANGFN